MFRTTRLVPATPQEVWLVLADGWLHPLWMVGATAMDDVDDGWPQPGTRLHHGTGAWPLVLAETTESLEADPAARLVLAVRGLLLGEARISLSLRPVGEQTEVVLERELVSGLRHLLPDPVRMPILRRWGEETLTRLCFVVEGRRRQHTLT